ncbi:MAG: hypothetical protein K8U57_21560 [Planctomycetes bacterium]|nr:hypothetical protein [Planctomycetota bacterium]
MPDEPKQSHLEDKLAVMDHVYKRYGRDGLKEYALADLTLFLDAKQLAFRDAPKGFNVSEDQKAANRLLELQLKDLTGYINTQLAGANLSVLQRFARQASSQEPQGKTQQRDHGQEK